MNFQQKLTRTLIFALTIFSSLLLSNQLNAQIKIGIKASTPTLSSKESTREYWEPKNGAIYGLTYISTKSSSSFGLSFYQDLKSAFVMTDVLFRKTSVEYRLEMSDNLTREAAQIFDQHRIVSVPIVAGYKNDNFKFGLGPIFNIKADSKFGLLQYEGFNLQNRKVEKAVQILVGFKIREHVHIDLRHEISLYSEGDDYNIVGNPLKIYSHPQSFSVSVGVYL